MIVRERQLSFDQYHFLFFSSYLFRNNDRPLMTLTIESICSEEDPKITSEIFDINLTNEFEGKALKICLY